MNKKLSVLVGLSGFLIIGLFCVFLCRKDKTAFVNINKLYTEFELKKELENKLVKIKNTRQAVLDSIELKLKILTRQINAEKARDKSKIALFQESREDYLAKKQQFEEDNLALVKEYDGQIYKQMTQYVDDFGKRQGYKYIYGADGTGSLMYADDANDISLEVIEFINKRYKGITN